MNYYALLVALVLVTALVMRGYREKNLKYVIVACLVIFFFYGLRDYHLGDDVRTSYLGNFWRMQELSWPEVRAFANKRNVLFFYTMKAFTLYISTDYQLYVSVIAAFVTICFGRMIYRYSPNPLQSILYHFGLLLFTFHFSILKQSVAMAILMLAFDKLVDRKPVSFLLIVLIASQFHFPALVFLPAYWITMLRPGRGFMILLSLMLLLTYLFRSQILNLMLQLYNEEETTVDLSNIAFIRTKALIMIFIVVAALIIRIPTSKDKVYMILLEFMGLSIVFQTFCGYSNVFERLADYYFQFAVVFIPMAFDKKSTQRSLLNEQVLGVVDTVAPFLFCGYAIYRFLTVVTADRFLYPFRFFFQE